MRKRKRERENKVKAIENVIAMAASNAFACVLRLTSRFHQVNIAAPYTPDEVGVKRM